MILCEQERGMSLVLELSFTECECYAVGWHEIRNTTSQPKNKQTGGADDKLSRTNLKEQLTSSSTASAPGRETGGRETEWDSIYQNKTER